MSYGASVGSAWDRSGASEGNVYPRGGDEPGEGRGRWQGCVVRVKGDVLLEIIDQKALIQEWVDGDVIGESAGLAGTHCAQESYGDVTRNRRGPIETSGTVTRYLTRNGELAKNLVARIHTGARR
jgi:hypothetical protein